MPVSMLVSVDLPEPFSPISACTAPLLTLKDTSRTAFVMPKDLDRCCTCSLISLIATPPYFTMALLTVFVVSATMISSAKPVITSWMAVGAPSATKP